jgi:transcriptional regulator with XRE-family HTH domain
LDLSSAIGARIKELRESRSITQNEMGRTLGHTDVYISQIETGKRRIGLDLLEKIAKSLDVSPLIFFKDVWPEEEAMDGVALLTRRVDQLRNMVEDLTSSVQELSEQRRTAAEPDATTAAISAISQSLDPAARHLLLEIAHAMQANPSALNRLPSTPPVEASNGSDLETSG